MLETDNKIDPVFTAAAKRVLDLISKQISVRPPMDIMVGGYPLVDNRTSEDIGRAYTCIVDDIAVCIRDSMGEKPPRA